MVVAAPPDADRYCRGRIGLAGLNFYDGRMLPTPFTHAVHGRIPLTGWWPWRKRPVDQPLDSAMASIFRVIHELDALADRHTADREPVAGGTLDAQEGLAFVDTAGAGLDTHPTALADALRKALDTLNDALEQMARCAEGKGRRGAH